MNQGSHSQTPIVFGLIIVLSGRLTTNGQTASCAFDTECGKPGIKPLCRFPQNATKSDKIRVWKIDGQTETLIIHHKKDGTTYIGDPTRYNVTFSPVVTVWIANASKNDTGIYVCDMPSRNNFKSCCNLTEEKLDDLKNIAQLTSTPASDSSSVSVSGHHRFHSTAEVFASSTSDNNAATDTLKAAEASGEAGFGAGVVAGVLLLVSAVTVIFICRRRRRENKNGNCHHSASAQSQTSQKCVYSNLPSDAENGGARHNEESKRQDMILPEVVQRLAENKECRQADEQVLNSVIELMKGFANSPGCSDSYADTTDKAAMKTNVKTKLMCRRGVDGSLELSIENRICSPDTFSEKEPAIAGQEADRLESPVKSCALVHRDTDMKISEDSKRASEIRLEGVPEKHSLTQERQSSDSFADDTHDLTRKAVQMQESPEASKIDTRAVPMFGQRTETV